MKPPFHIPARPAVASHRSAHHPSDVAPGAWLTAFSPWRPAPFLRMPPVAEGAGRDLRSSGCDAAPVRRSDVLLQAERLVHPGPVSDHCGAVFTTPRLSMGTWARQDAGTLLDIYSRWEVARWLGAAPRPLTCTDEAV